MNVIKLVSSDDYEHCIFVRVKLRYKTIYILDRCI